MVDLTDIRRAGERLFPHVRRTPLLCAGPLRRPVSGAEVRLKLESLQGTGSFTTRGATHKVLTLPPGEAGRGLVTASGGNHGLGVAYAGSRLGAPVVIYLPANAPRSKAERLERWGARVVWQGDVWDDSDRAAREAAEREGWTYVHAFAD